jgi:hypothetical protein
MGEPGESYVPVTEWVLDKMITVPYENLETPAALAYFVVASPAIGVGAINGYAIDELSHTILPAAGAIVGVGDSALGAIADLVGAGDSPQELLEKVEQIEASKAEAKREPSSPPASDSAASGDQGDDAACYPVAGDGSEQADADAAQDEDYPLPDAEEAPAYEGEPDGE